MQETDINFYILAVQTLPVNTKVTVKVKYYAKEKQANSTMFNFKQEMCA